MLEHVQTIKAREAIEQINLLSVVGKNQKTIDEIAQPYMEIVHGKETLSDDRIKRDRETLRRLLKDVKNINGSNKRIT